MTTTASTSRWSRVSWREPEARSRERPASSMRSLSRGTLMSTQATSSNSSGRALRLSSSSPSTSAPRAALQYAVARGRLLVLEPPARAVARCAASGHGRRTPYRRWPGSEESARAARMLRFACRRRGCRADGESASTRRRPGLPGGNWYGYWRCRPWPGRRGEENVGSVFVLPRPYGVTGSWFTNSRVAMRYGRAACERSRSA